MLYDSIILTSDQAAYVRGGEYENNAVLMPRLLDNKEAMAAAGPPYDLWSGTTDYYFLAARIISHPDFNAVSDYLAAIGHQELETDILFLPPPDEE